MPAWPRRRRHLVALQVEVSSRCTRACRVCPRSALGPLWVEGDLDHTLWERLCGDLALARHVHLQGWGEPLLHPELPAMVAAAKQAGCSVGITTNGDLLSEALPWIREARVDLVTVSVAGGDSTHARLRDGSRLGEILAVARELVRTRRRRRTHVKLSYLLTRQNAAELAGVVELAAEHDMDGVVVNHLDTTPTQYLLQLAAFTSSGPATEVSEALDAAEAVARDRRMRLWLPNRSAQTMLTCALDPVRMAFVGWDGRVGPCVNLLVPIKGEIPRQTHEGRLRVEPECWGSIRDSFLAQILQGEARREFIAPLEARLEAERRFLSACAVEPGAEALARLHEADGERTEALLQAPFPGPCAGCHAQLGW
jgi:MoaA/NifB/PqqE/SkfB family radical SAM enzyme